MSRPIFTLFGKSLNFRSQLILAIIFIKMVWATCWYFHVYLGQKFRKSPGLLFLVTFGYLTSSCDLIRLYFLLVDLKQQFRESTEIHDKSKRFVMIKVDVRFGWFWLLIAAHLMMTLLPAILIATTSSYKDLWSKQKNFKKKSMF